MGNFGNDLETNFWMMFKSLYIWRDLCIHFYWLSRLRQASHRKMIQSSALRLIACPSAWSIQVSFFYVPKNYPKRIREKKQSPWTIQILSQNFFLNLAMFKIFSMSQELSGEKNKHLELSKYYPILQGLSQIFSDTSWK